MGDRLRGCEWEEGTEVQRMDARRPNACSEEPIDFRAQPPSSLRTQKRWDVEGNRHENGCLKAISERSHVKCRFGGDFHMVFPLKAHKRIKSLPLIAGTWQEVDELILAPGKLSERHLGPVWPKRPRRLEIPSAGTRRGARRPRRRPVWPSTARPSGASRPTPSLRRSRSGRRRA